MQFPPIEPYDSGTLDAQWIEKYGGELMAAMDAYDQMLEKMVTFVDANSDYTLVLASSMGQAAIAAEHTYEFLTIAHLDKFDPQTPFGCGGHQPVAQAPIHHLRRHDMIAGLQ